MKENRTNRVDPSTPTTAVLVQRYKDKFRESAVSQVYDLMRKNDVSVEDIKAYVASKDSNRSPLGRIQEFKANHGVHVSDKRTEPGIDGESTSSPTDDSSQASGSPKATSVKTVFKSRPN